MKKAKIGLYSAAGCGGCDIAVLEIHEKILDLLEVADVIFWPCLMDFKYRDLELLPDGGIDVCFFSGAIRNEENENLAALLRRKAGIMVAYGSCSCWGGVPGLSNVHPMGETFDRIYRTAESNDNPEGILPRSRTDLGDGRSLTLPRPLPRLKTLRDVIGVDYFMPGCPPTEKQTWKVCQDLVAGRLPPRGSLIGAGVKNLCEECPREKIEGRKLTGFRRLQEFLPDEKTCLMEQGLVCLGPATRSGCEARCIQAGVPCRGCYGPVGNAVDHGAGMAGLIGSIIDSENEREIQSAIEGIVDPLGTFYRYSLPASLLGRSRGMKEGGAGPASDPE